MTHLVSVAVALCMAGVLVGAYLLLKHFKIDFTIATKVAAVLLFCGSFVRYLYKKPAVYNVMGLSDPVNSPFNSIEAADPTLTAFAILLVWFSYAAILLTVISAFFNYKTLRRLVNLFALPVFVTILVAYETYGIANLGQEGFALSEWRFWVLALEIGIAISIAVSNSLEAKTFEIPRKWSEVGNYFYALFFAIIAIMPCYVPQAFFTSVDNTIVINDLTPEHRIILYIAVAIPVIAYQLLKNKSSDVNRCILIYASIAFLWIYIGRWEIPEFADPRNLPLHLCNTAMFLYPLCLVFKLKRLFNFCLFINVLGTLFAMLMPNTSVDHAIETESINFWLNHYVAFFMPLLMVSLKIFQRPKFKQWIYAVVTLIAYYVSMLFTNAYLTGQNGDNPDFFFTNSDFVVSKLGKWAEDTREFTVSITFNGVDMVFYPIYQAIFIGVYLLLSVVVWFLLGMLFNALDAEEDRRKRAKDYKRMKKDLKKYLGGKPATESITGDTSPSLVIRNFSKRYGSNKHYSVKDVSFEVKGGEIFGFLGPNGAGKSTIIKSVVGIQTITSGNIEICGFDVEKQPVAAKMNTAFVPDHYALYENLTGREYINYIADLYGVSKQERDEIINKYVEAFQLVGAFDNQMKTYSHGMKQKITIMSALVHNPKVWILDEPLTGLDPTSIHEVKECMKEHAAKGNIVFFSSHIIDVVEKLCDKIAIIKKGQLRAFTSLEELAEQGIELEQYYLDIIYDGQNDEHVPYVEEEEGKEEAKA